MFKVQKKKIEMALKAAEEIRPIVSLIRTLESSEKTSDIVYEQINEANCDARTLLSTISRVYGKDVKEDLEKLHVKHSDKCDKLMKESEAQKNQLISVDDEIGEYLAYTALFPYVGEEAVATELLKKATAIEATEDEFYACVLLLLNDKVDYDENFFIIATEMAADVSDRFKKHILMNIDELDQNEICRYIRQG